MRDIKKITNIGLLTAMALAISLIEHMIPIPVPIPGAKLGFSNMIILLTLYFYGLKSALLVGVLKSFLLMLITGSVTAFFYSFAGAVLASISMGLSLKLLNKFSSFIGISEIGAFFHNLGQILVAAVFMGNIKMLIYFPALVMMGVFTSFFVGLSVNYVASHMDKLNIGDIKNEKGN
ncbi:Gx transporter family protein [Anaerococcus sp. mt242]|uniref:Gx transporter family protein n=1 Tax=Anaerococcus sp. mt242 TaxID=2661917 RepID=UPI001932B561|nr:Gx transporter family protein [Anaerococcus sp. mt242]MBM0045929.1 Gx transporter family protein [Anaerococcus sp. mt242]